LISKLLAGKYILSKLFFGGAVMAIGSAVQKGAFIYIYDEKGRQIGSVSAGGKPPDGLTGFTSSSVSVRKGAFIYIYDERGRQTGSTSAR